MSNQIPRTYDPVVQLLEAAVDGADQFGAAIGLKQNTKAEIRADLVALIGEPAGPDNVPPAKPGLKALWNTAKANKTAKSAALRSVESNGRALAMTCIGALKPVLGQQWNSAWNAAGFTGGSLRVPTHPQPLLLQLRAYYTANPTREAPDINGVACTAAVCQAMANVITEADKESNQSNTDAATAQAALEAGMDAAQTRLAGLLAELDQLLVDDDPRWLAFGFDMPGHSSTPDEPVNLVAVPGAVGSGTLFVHCDDARRATGYRFTVLDAATAAKLVEQLTQDAEATLTGLPAGLHVKVVVRARNTTGESQPSAAAAAVVP